MVFTNLEVGEGLPEAEASKAQALLEQAAQACQRVLEQEGAGMWHVSLTLVGSARMRQLNAAYRGVDAPTDVLSFSQREGPGPQVPSQGEPLLGDVVVAWDVAKAQAQAYGHSVEREVAFLAVHGTLHLLGYDHQDPQAEEDMMARGERVLEAMGLSRPGRGEPHP
jgi:probable rRNA maturation factor